MLWLIYVVVENKAFASSEAVTKKVLYKSKDCQPKIISPGIVLIFSKACNINSVCSLFKFFYNRKIPPSTCGAQSETRWIMGLPFFFLKLKKKKKRSAFLRFST